MSETGVLYEQLSAILTAIGAIEIERVGGEVHWNGLPTRWHDGVPPAGGHRPTRLWRCRFGHITEGEIGLTTAACRVAGCEDPRVRLTYPEDTGGAWFPTLHFGGQVLDRVMWPDGAVPTGFSTCSNGWRPVGAYPAGSWTGSEDRVNQVHPEDRRPVCEPAPEPEKPSLAERIGRPAVLYFGNRLLLSTAYQGGGAPIVDESVNHIAEGTTPYPSVTIRRPQRGDRSLVRPNWNAKAGEAVVVGWRGRRPWWLDPQRLVRRGIKECVPPPCPPLKAVRIEGEFSTAVPIDKAEEMGLWTPEQIAEAKAFYGDTRMGAPVEPNFVVGFDPADNPYEGAVVVGQAADGHFHVVNESGFHPGEPLPPVDEDAGPRVAARRPRPRACPMPVIREAEPEDGMGPVSHQLEVCGEDLVVNRVGGGVFYDDEVYEHVSSWQVGCMGGHVLLTHDTEDREAPEDRGLIDQALALLEAVRRPEPVLSMDDGEVTLYRDNGAWVIRFAINDTDRIAHVLTDAEADRLFAALARWLDPAAARPDEGPDPTGRPSFAAYVAEQGGTASQMAAASMIEAEPVGGVIVMSGRGAGKTWLSERYAEWSAL